MKLRVQWLSWIAMGTLIVGCNAGKNKPNIELIQDMMKQPSLKAQEAEPSNPEETAMKVPPKGTVPQNFEPFKYGADANAAGREMTNPMAGDFSPDVLVRGKEHYRIYCGVCHGDAGMGNGSVAPKMALRPPSLLSDKVKNHPDGRLFHIITQGQGVMGSYASQIPDRQDRWAIINYIRTLQKKGSTKSASN